MVSKKAQASAEYLIIVLVAITIALIAVGVMRWFPGLGIDISQEESRQYWNNTVPLSIYDWKITPELDESRFVIENKSTDYLYVDEIMVNDYNLGILPDVLIAPGERGVVSGLVGTMAPFENQFKYDVEIFFYEYENPARKMVLVGEKPLVGVSIGRVSTDCICGSWTDNSCGGGGCGGRMQQSRTCSPVGCDSVSQCECTGTCCNARCAEDGKNGVCLGDLGCSCWG